MQQVAERHQQEIRQQVQACRQARSRLRRGPRRAGSRRERLGWALVELGLRLALGPVASRPAPGAR
jgi:hypothetical protein